MDGSMMVWFSGLNKKSEESGFIVVYPSGTGVGPFRTWNAGGFSGKMAEGKADDVAFIGKLLDDLNGFVKVDEKRVYACGMSNGGMMCYRLAAELFDRIAAIAPVAGTIAIEDSKPKRPVPVMHFHGTKDDLVPFEMADHPSSRRTAILAVHIVNRDFNCCYGILCPLRFDKRLDHHNLALLNRTDRTCHGRRCKQRVSSFHRAKNDRQRHMK